MIHFLLGDCERRVTGLDPTTSVLDYLRETEQLKGTKEGCGTGDCGACTVVLAEPEGDGLRYRAANACVTSLGSLHGKQLIVVEHLKHDGKLHPVQQAMVDCHGSQCGFCTPGIVMSLFAHLHTHDRPEKAALVDSLGGNLCRCTGYSPVLAAGISMYAGAQEDQFTREHAATMSRLDTIAATAGEIELEANGWRYHAPQSVARLASLLQRYPEAILLAGGTDLMLELGQTTRMPGMLLYTGRVMELQLISDSGHALEIGSGVNFSECAQQLIHCYPGLKELLQRFGSRQIRNLGTLAGNIASASPCGDMLPFLIVVGADLVLRRGDDTRTVSVESFLLGYRKTSLRRGEFIERIIIPRAKAGYFFQAYKISKRLDDDIAITAGAFQVRVEDGVVKDVAIAFGGMADMAKRARRCEEALRGQAWNEATVERAALALEADFTPISDFRASAGYRMQASKNLLQRLFLQHKAQAAELQVTRHV